MDNLNPFLSFILVLIALAACVYVLYLGSNLLEKNTDDPAGQVFHAEGGESKVAIRIQSTGGVILILASLCGIISILYMYWMYALPILALGGGSRMLMTDNKT